MPGYLELLRQERIRAGENCLPIRYLDGQLIRKFVFSYTPHDFLELNARRDIKNKFFNDINHGAVLEKDPLYEETNLTKKFEAPLYRAAFETLLAKCPEGVLNSRYLQAVTDAEAFLATWGAQAEALGWTAEELFGLDPFAPLARYDAMGLIWFLRGEPVVALTERTAAIGAGTRFLTFYRRGSDLPWRHHHRVEA